MELSDYLRILRNHWLGVLVIAVTTVALAAVYNVTQPKVYEANSTGLFQGSPGTDPALASISDSLAKSKAKSYLTIATSRAAAQGVIDDLGLDATPAQLSGQISAAQPEDTTQIALKARASTPQEAQTLADAWLKALIGQVATLEDPKGTDQSAIRIVPYESAALPGAPVSPAVRRNLGIGLVLGLMLGFGYAMVRNQFDRRIRSAASVERDFDVTVVGAIPTAPILAHARGTMIDLVVTSESRQDADQSAGEAFRKLRTNLQFMSVDSPPRVMVVTSPLPGDGKSVAAGNLAASIAASGSPVILVDGDLRRPTVAANFGLVEGAGLTDVLIGRADADEVLQQHDTLDHLQILAVGSVPPNPSELLGSQAMRKLLQSLGERATVIVDAPPLLPVTDAALLTAETDGALVVVSAGKTLDTELAAALDHLATVHGKALGVVMNRVPPREVYSSYYRLDEADAPARRSFFSRSGEPALGGRGGKRRA